MISARLHFARCSGRLAAALVAVWFAATAGAGERIIFSGRDGARDLPGSTKKQQLLEPSLNDRRVSGPGGNSTLDALLLPPGAPATAPAPDKHQRDMQERRRNWMFQDPNDPKNREGEKGAPVKDDKDEDGPPKNSIERFMEGKDRKSSSKSDANGKNGNTVQPRDANPRYPQHTDPNNRTSPADAAAQPRSDGSLPAAGREMDAGRATAADLKGAGGLSRSVGERREREREARMSAFEKLINPGAAAPGGDAGLLGAGAAARPDGIQPSARGGVDFSRKNDFLGGNPLPGLNTPRFSGREEFNAKPGGVPNFLPEQPRYSEPLRVQPKPTVLELPKRKI